MSDSSDEMEELRDQIDSLKSKYDDLEARYHAVMAKNDTLRDILLGDYEAGESAVREAPSVWEQLEDLRSESATTKERIRRLDSAGARGQPGAARVAKIRHALVKKATRNRGGAMGQTSGDSPAMDYEDVLALFDYEIDRSYASKLLEKAATKGDGSGAFWVKKHGNSRNGRKTLRLSIGELDEDSPYLRHSRRASAADSREEGSREFGNTEHTSGGGAE